jgi:hypothetical protein
MRPFPFDQQTEAGYVGPEWQERTGVAQLAQVLFRKAEDQFLMLAFYGDGSGEHGNGPFVVAGYLADSIDWFHLECDWERELKKSPSIRYFKARECVLRQQGNGSKEFSGEFFGWTTDAVRRKCTAMAQVLESYSPRMVAICSPMHWDVYHGVVGDDVFRQVFWTPYLFCAHGAIELALKKSNEQFKLYRGPVAFVFDTESAQLDADTRQHYDLAPNHLPSDLRSRCGSLTFTDDIKFPMLQPADFLAWSIRAQRAGQESPWVDTIFTNFAGGSHEIIMRPARLREIIRDTEDKFHKEYPDWKSQQVSLKARKKKK